MPVTARLSSRFHEHRLLLPSLLVAVVPTVMTGQQVSIDRNYSFELPSASSEFYRFHLSPPVGAQPEGEQVPGGRSIECDRADQLVPVADHSGTGIETPPLMFAFRVRDN